MKKKSSLLVKGFAVLLLILILSGPVLLNAAVEKADCRAALKKCIGDAFLSAFYSIFSVFAFPMTATFCVIGYEWCLLYYD
jgi:hypothetical protein